VAALLAAPIGNSTAIAAAWRLPELAQQYNTTPTLKRNAWLPLLYLQHLMHMLKLR
jgi:hypothetical protein